MANELNAQTNALKEIIYAWGYPCKCWCPKCQMQHSCWIFNFKYPDFCCWKVK